VDIQHLIHSYGYVGIIGALFVEHIGVPFPAETALVASGFAWGQGDLKFLPLFVSVVFGTLAGSLAAYLIGFYLGRPVILRYGKWVGITPERMDRAEEKFNKYTVPLLIFSNFLAGVRVLTPIMAGMNKTRLTLFVTYTLVGSAIWGVLFLLIGRFVGHEWKRWEPMLHRFIIPIVVLVGVTVLIVWLFKVRNKRRARLRT
jgi:membrane protein DedA with SNARE-associated domain